MGVKSRKFKENIIFLDGKCNKIVFLFRSNILVQQSLIRSSTYLTRNFSTPKKQIELPEDNTPIKFIGTPAASMFARTSRHGPNVNLEDIPWFQPYVVVGSVAIFMLYFCYFREENDMDQELERTLYERVPGLEETQLVLSYRYNIENNIDTADIVKRMEELGMDVEAIKS